MDYIPIIKSIVEKIKNLRESRDMSQKSVAGRELSLRIYQKIEAGEGFPSMKSILIIADALGIHPKELFDVPLLKNRPIKKAFPKRKRMPSSRNKKQSSKNIEKEIHKTTSFNR